MTNVCQNRIVNAWNYSYYRLSIEHGLFSEMECKFMYRKSFILRHEFRWHFDVPVQRLYECISSSPILLHRRKGGSVQIRVKPIPQLDPPASEPKPHLSPGKSLQMLPMNSTKGNPYPSPFLVSQAENLQLNGQTKNLPYKNNRPHSNQKIKK